MEQSLQKYDLPSDLEVIRSMPKESFSNVVRNSVTKTALNHLQTECSGLKKTANLKYDALKLQDYLSVLYPSESKVIFKWRSETLDIKPHLSYKYDDLSCRECTVETEEPYHILNCGWDDEISNNIDILNLSEIDEITKFELKRMIIRIRRFLEKVSENAGKVVS